MINKFMYLPKIIIIGHIGCADLLTPGTIPMVHIIILLLGTHLIRNTEVEINGLNLSFQYAFLC